eukprot:Nk52_evm9s418 gene=Nk52_evmTU9s418
MVLIIAALLSSCADKGGAVPYPPHTNGGKGMREMVSNLDSDINNISDFVDNKSSQLMADMEEIASDMARLAAIVEANSTESSVEGDQQNPDTDTQTTVQNSFAAQSTVASGPIPEPPADISSSATPNPVRPSFDKNSPFINATNNVVGALASFNLRNIIARHDVQMAQLFRQLGGPYVLELVSPAVMAVLSRNASSPTLNTTQTMSRDRRGQAMEMLCLECLFRKFVGKDAGALPADRRKLGKVRESSYPQSKLDSVYAKLQQTVEEREEIVRKAPFRPSSELEEFLNTLWEHDIVQHGMGLGNREREQGALEEVEQLNFESLSGPAKDMLTLRTRLLRVGVTIDMLYALSLTDIDKAAVLDALCTDNSQGMSQEKIKMYTSLSSIASAADSASKYIEETLFTFRPIENPELAAESPLYSAKKAVPSLRDLNKLLVNAAIVKVAGDEDGKNGGGNEMKQARDENEFKDKAMEVLKQVVRVGSKAQNAAATGLFIPENWLDDPPTIEPLQIRSSLFTQQDNDGPSPNDLQSQLAQIIDDSSREKQLDKDTPISISSESRPVLSSFAKTIQEAALEGVYKSYFIKGLSYADETLDKPYEKYMRSTARDIIGKSKKTLENFFEGDENVNKLLDAVLRSKDASSGDKSVSKMFMKIRKKDPKDASSYLAEKMCDFMINDIQSQYNSLARGEDPPEGAFQPILLSRDPSSFMTLETFQKIVFEGQMAFGKTTFVDKVLLSTPKPVTPEEEETPNKDVSKERKEAYDKLLLSSSRPEAREIPIANEEIEKAYGLKYTALLEDPTSAQLSSPDTAVSDVCILVKGILESDGKEYKSSARPDLGKKIQVQVFDPNENEVDVAKNMFEYFSMEVAPKVMDNIRKLPIERFRQPGGTDKVTPELAESFFSARRGIKPATTPERVIQNALDEIAEHILIRNAKLPFRVKLSEEVNQQMSEKMNDVFGQMTTKVRKATIQQSMALIQTELMDYIPQPTTEQKAQIADMSLVIATFFPNPEDALAFTRASANSGLSLKNPKVKMERSAKAAQIRDTVIDSVTEEMNEQVSSILWDSVYQSSGNDIELIHVTLRGMKTDIEKRSLETINGLLRAHQLSQESEEVLRSKLKFSQYQQKFKNGNDEENAPLLIEDDHSEDVLSQISKALNQIFVLETAQNYNAPESSFAREKGSPQLVATEIHRAESEDGGESEREPDSAIRSEERKEDMRSTSENRSAANAPYGEPDDGQQIVSTEDVR